MESESDEDSPDGRKKRRASRTPKHLKSFKNAYREMKDISRAKKLSVGLAIMTICLPLCGFFGISYYLSSNILYTLQSGFDAYEVFYNRVPCLADTLFFLQSAIYQNSSLTLESQSGKRLQ